MERKFNPKQVLMDRRLVLADLFELEVSEYVCGEKSLI
jgi:hypothetical protein